MTPGEAVSFWALAQLAVCDPGSPTTSPRAQAPAASSHHPVDRSSAAMGEGYLQRSKAPRTPPAQLKQPVQQAAPAQQQLLMRLFNLHMRPWLAPKLDFLLSFHSLLYCQRPGAQQPPHSAERPATLACPRTGASDFAWVGFQQSQLFMPNGLLFAVSSMFVLLGLTAPWTTSQPRARDPSSANCGEAMLPTCSSSYISIAK
ncbi:hypothetical protein V8E36_005335 [Tilletia maclaganii]